LLADLRVVFGDNDSMTTRAILGALHVLPEAPWGDIKGKPLNDRQLAVRLRQYGVRSKALRIGPKDTAKGYSRADLAEAWEVYLSPLSPATSETSETSETNPDLQGVDVLDVSDVSDTGSNVPAHGGAQKADKTGFVSDVSDVSDAAGNGDAEPFPPVCVHCGEPERPGEPVQEVHVDGECYLLHRRCENGWLDTNEQPASPADTSLGRFSAGP
jgi:hypothetical protein